MTCPFCLKETTAEASVCGSCGRDIAVPNELVAERNNLIRKRDTVRLALMEAKAEIERLTHRTRSKSV